MWISLCFGLSVLQQCAQLQQIRPHVFVVQYCRSFGPRVEQVYVYEQSEYVVGAHWNKEKQVSGIVGESSEKTKENPIGQPLLTCLEVFSFKCLYKYKSTR